MRQNNKKQCEVRLEASSYLFQIDIKLQRVVNKKKEKKYNWGKIEGITLKSNKIKHDSFYVSFVD